MLEYFVHLEAADAPPDLVLVTAEVPDDVTSARVAVGNLPVHWRRSPSLAELARIGDDFVRRAERCILIAPSALAPHENNWLLNPQHADFRRVVVSSVEPLSYDQRMFAARRQRRRKR
jgi:RES domain-containing protein